jgi:oligoendopeptidase F
MGNQKNRTNREDVPEKQTWDLSDIFPSREDWERELKAVQEDVESVTQYKKRLNENSKVLLQCLEAKEELLKRFTLVASYASLKQTVDHTDTTSQKDAARAEEAGSRINASLAFVETEIIALPKDTLENFLDEEEDLQSFKKYLTDLQDRKPHTLGEETEETLAALGSVFSAPYNIYNRGKLSDMQFDSFTDEEGNELPLSFALYEGKYSSSPSADVRRNSYESFVKTLQKYKNSFAATYATQVNQEVITARLRKYDSVTDMLLEPQQVTKEMYNNQLDIIQEELAPHMRKFARLKKRELGLDQLTFADLHAPLDPDFKIETSYEEGAETVKEALKVM